MARLLPRFLDYTVDLRLKEFRRACPACFELECISFGEEKGDAMLLDVLAFYRAGGTLYYIENKGGGLNVIPIPLSEVEQAII